MKLRKPAIESAFGFRVFLFAFCGLIAGSIVYGVAIAPDWPPASTMTALGIVGLICLAGMCFAALRTFPTAGEAYDALMRNAPTHSPHALICRLTTVLGKAMVVILDEEERTIHFGDCHTPRRFLAWGEQWRSCSLDDVVAAHSFRHKGHESLTIVTQAGSALVPDGMENYGRLKERLEALLPAWHAGFSAEHPMMGMIYVGAALVGIFVAIMFAPKRPGDQTLVFWAIGGAVGAVALARLAVTLADRYLGLSIVPALGLAGIGVLMGGALASWLNLRLETAVILIAASGILGFVVGIINQRRGMP